MAGSIYDWSTTASSNGTADGDINWQENQPPDTVNNSARQMMGRVAELVDDITPTRTSTGTGTTYIVTASSSPATLPDGFEITFYPNRDCPGTCFLSVNSFGAIPLRGKSGVELLPGQFLAGVPLKCYYKLSTTEWIAENTGYPFAQYMTAFTSTDITARILKVGMSMAWHTETVPNGWLEENGQAVSRSAYPELWALYSTNGTLPGIYGNGDGSTTFNVRDTRGLFKRGWNHGASADPDAASRTDRGDGTTGDHVGTKQGSQYTAHTHAPGTLVNSTTGAHTHTSALPITTNFGGVQSGLGGATNIGTLILTTTSNGDHTHTISGATASMGGNETRPTNISEMSIVLANPAAAAAGALGVNGLQYKFGSFSASAVDPGTGTLSTSAADFVVGHTGTLYISKQEQTTADVGAFVATFSTGQVIKVNKVGALATFAILTLTGAATSAGAGAYYTMTYIVTASGGTIAAADQLSAQITGTGAAGATGPVGPAGGGIHWTFDTGTAAANPGTGLIRLNNASAASATHVYVSVTDADGGDETAWLTFLGASSSSVKGTLQIIDKNNAGTFAIYKVTAVTNNTTYFDLTVTYVSSHFGTGTTFAAAAYTDSTFNATGDAGSGSIAGATTNGVGIANGANSMTSTAALTDGQIVVGQTGNPPLPKTMSGDATLAASGALSFALGVEHAWTAQQYFALATLTDGASIAWNLSTQQTAKVTLGGNRTLAAPSNMKAGARYSLFVIQDGTGNRTLAYNAAYIWLGGVTPVIATAAGTVSRLDFVSDGTNMYGVMASNSSTSVAWGVISGTPTTLSGYGITDAATLASANIFTAAQTIKRDGIGSTSTDALLLRNTTAAAAGAQQYSPRSVWEGQGWKTNATAASQAVAFMAETRPVQGAANPTGTWALAASINGGAYSDVLAVSSLGGVALTAGTITTSQPLTYSATWNAGGVSFDGYLADITNTASAATSYLFRGRVGGTDQFSVQYNGTNPVINLKSTTSTVYSIAGSGANLAFYYGGTTNNSVWFTYGIPGVVVPIGGYFGFSSSTAFTAADVILTRDAANTLALRNSTSAQTFNNYGTFTDTGNYRRLAIAMTTAGVASIKPEGAGSGASGNVLHISGLPTSNPGPGILWNNAGSPAIGT